MIARIALALLGASLTLGDAPVRKSDPIAYFGIIEKVVYEPNATNPQAVQIWGVFSVTEARPGDFYKPPQKGYLYFSMNSANEKATLAEWRDLASLAGKNQAVGFGAKWSKPGRLRAPTESPASPDTYSLGVGVLKVFDNADRAGIEKALKAAAAPAKKSGTR